MMTTPVKYYSNARLSLREAKPTLISVMIEKTLRNSDLGCLRMSSLYCIMSSILKILLLHLSEGFYYGSENTTAFKTMLIELTLRCHLETQG